MDLEEIKKALFKLELLENQEKGYHQQLNVIQKQIIQIESVELPKLLGLEPEKRIYARPLANLFLKLIEEDKKGGS